MKFYVAFVLFVLVLMPACSENTVSTPDVEATPTWNDFQITQTYYDSLKITSENRILLPDQRVQSVIVLTETDGRYIGRDTVSAAYVPANDGYFLNYTLYAQVSDRDVDAAIRIRYQNADGSIVRVDTTEYMLDYAYEGVEVYISTLSLENGTTLGSFNFQDFDLTLNSIFFHPIGQAGIYDYRYSQLRSEELVGALSGNYITTMQNFLFYEVAGVRLFKLSVQSPGQSEEIDLSAITYNDIRGLAGWQDKLFILFGDPSGNFLGIFDIDGNLFETVDFPRDCFYMTISSSGILYTNEYPGTFEPGLLVRFDLNSETFLADKIHPGYSPTGLRVWGDKLFFTDYPKPVMASVPIATLDE